MKKRRSTVARIMGVLRQMEGGVPAAELCREYGMISATLSKWRAKYGRTDASLISESEPLSAIGPRAMASGDVRDRYSATTHLARNTDQHLIPMLGNVDGDQQSRRD